MYIYIYVYVYVYIYVYIYISYHESSRDTPFETHRSSPITFTSKSNSSMIDLDLLGFSAWLMTGVEGAPKVLYDACGLTGVFAPLVAVKLQLSMLQLWCFHCFPTEVFHYSTQNDPILWGCGRMGILTLYPSGVYGWIHRGKSTRRRKHF